MKRERYPDIFLPVLLSVGFFLLYSCSTAPSVLDGDSAELQYIPYVLGIPHPTGYPLYILLGKIWSFLPVGTVAYRMNLLSGVYGAASIGMIYLLLRRVDLKRIAAAVATLTFGLTPTFWWYSTVAAVYTLNVLLLAISGWLLLWATDTKPEMSRKKIAVRLSFAAFFLGLGMANHPTFIFLLPGAAVFLLLKLRRELFQPMLLVYLIGFFLLGLSPHLYTYVQGNLLLSQGADLIGVPDAMARGLVPTYFKPGIESFIHYVSGGNFTERFTDSWLKLDLTKFFSILSGQFGLLSVVFGFLGAVILAVRKPSRFVLVFTVFAIAGLSALKYSQDFSQRSEIVHIEGHLLPAYLFFTVWVGACVDSILSLFQKTIRGKFGTYSYLVLATTALVFPLTMPFLVKGQFDNALGAKVQEYWTDVLASPLEKDAALLGQWGDLTSFWYLQHGEHQREDLVAFYPPTLESVEKLLGTERVVYLSGPTLGWLPDSVADIYQISSWGKLARIDKPGTAHVLPAGSKETYNFGDEVKLIGHTLHSDALQASGDISIDLYFQAIKEIPADYMVSIRLANKGYFGGQKDDRLTSAWLPTGKLKAGSTSAVFLRVPIPPGTLPQEYQVQVSVFSGISGRELDVLEGRFLGKRAVIGEVEIGRIRPAVSGQTVKKAIASYGDAIDLIGATMVQTEALPGDKVHFSLVWQAAGKITDDLSALITLVDSQGREWGKREFVVGSNLLSAKDLQKGETVRDEIEYLLPPLLMPGMYSIEIGIKLGEGDSPLARLNSNSESNYGLKLLDVKPREHVWELPATGYMSKAVLADFGKLQGYDLNITKQGPGATLLLSLFWEATGSTETEKTVFIHLLGKDGSPKLQNDQPPRHGLSSTTSWLKGEIIEDDHFLVLAPDLPDGQYPLVVGMYEPETGNRVPITNGYDGTASDKIVLGLLEVRGGTHNFLANQ